MMKTFSLGVHNYLLRNNRDFEILGTRDMHSKITMILLTQVHGTRP